MGSKILSLPYKYLVILTLYSLTPASHVSDLDVLALSTWGHLWVAIAARSEIKDAP